VPNFLRDLSLKEVSFVDFPANSGAEVLLFKREHGARELWDEFVSEHLSIHNKKLKELKAHPPETFSLEELKELQLKKPWSREEASASARKTREGSGLWQAVVAEARPPLSKGQRMYGSLTEIVTAVKKGQIETVEAAEEAFDELVNTEVVKGGYATNSQNMRLAKRNDPAWNEYFNVVMRLPATAQEKEAIEKSHTESADVLQEINTLAKRILDAGDAPTIEQATVLVCKRFPELEKRYYEAIR